LHNARTGAPDASARPARIPDGLRIYCVGDVHGQLELLDRVANWVNDDLARSPMPAVTVFLGDYIDRGPNSFGVVDRLSKGEFPTQIRALRGNHEEMILTFLQNDKSLDAWRRYGALETLHSYGVPVIHVMRGKGFDVAQATLREKMPAHHLEFYQKTEFCAVAGDYYFCHAGIKPGVSLDEQNPTDLMWIREEFIKAPGPFEKRIVHGHTPVGKPVVMPDRINIDTGAYANGTLTCLALEGDTTRLFTTSRA
jgi:serine/threonine protein phosphatase 1